MYVSVNTTDDTEKSKLNQNFEDEKESENSMQIQENLKKNLNKKTLLQFLQIHKFKILIIGFTILILIRFSFLSNKLNQQNHYITTESLIKYSTIQFQNQMSKISSITNNLEVPSNFYKVSSKCPSKQLENAITAYKDNKTAHLTGLELMNENPFSPTSNCTATFKDEVSKECWNSNIYQKWKEWCKLSEILYFKRYNSLSFKPASRPTSNFDIEIFILTSKDRHRKKADILMTTWGQFFPYIYFITNEEDDQLPIIKLINNENEIENQKNSTSTTSSNYWTSHRKVLYTIKQFENGINSNKRWFLIVNDETLVIPDSLIKLTRQYDFSKAYFIGQGGVFEDFYRVIFDSGWLISLEMAKKLLLHIDDCMDFDSIKYFKNDAIDLSVIACLNSKMTKKIIPTHRIEFNWNNPQEMALAYHSSCKLVNNFYLNRNNNNINRNVVTKDTINNNKLMCFSEDRIYGFGEAVTFTKIQSWINVLGKWREYRNFNHDLGNPRFRK